VFEGVRTGKSSWIWVGTSLLLVLAAVVFCFIAVGLGLWISRTSLVMVPPPVTPTLISGPPTPLPSSPQPPEAGVQPRSSAPQIPGLPEDIPLPDSADPQSFVGVPNQYSFLAGMSYQDAVAFYQEKLPDQGWEKIAYGTRLGQSSAELHYHKEGRTLTIRVVNLPFVGRLIEISLQA
jgi:hypothetical protein